MELKDLNPSNSLRTRTVIRDNNPDWTSHDSSAAQHFAAAPPGMQAAFSGLAGPQDVGDGDAAAAAAQQQILLGAQGLPQRGAIPGQPFAASGREDISQYVTINPSIAIFAAQPMLKQYAVVAISQAIHDIITPVVERSVTIACITTRELLLKDFAMETDEAKVRRAAHLMVQHLAGSLALVTCKEPLRVSMCNQLRTYLQRQQAGDQQAIEQAVQVTAADNLEFGCWLIEKSAIERAMRDIDTALDNAINLRRKQGPAAFESPIFGARPQPESLMPKASGLGPSQLRVYDDFARDPRQAPTGPAGNA
eukprot:CAMPEP_0175883488 /NCGR_PEP_ID=MMETSP0107_2-20121207/44004_1 /TAXON_ID=195067 ORGANISM="Goniomonas pacifica, Strain CCMP1869" /NCGR_SAMPLE_ID=MMETSP0107_2 /ASSEMBLY_ACC=CAM_ASM_000203 /LENGTH=307 /DNA_ID=CAMNT_0017203555 /DNA_START=14 /DNA_END=933 /DNA_ORIENTATION=+